MSPALYLDLLKKSLLGELYWENEARLLYLRQCLENKDTFQNQTLLHIEQERVALCRAVREGMAIGRFLDDDVANLGYQHTMAGRLRLENVEMCLQQIVDDDIPGDVMECGVCRGGIPIFLRGFLRAHGVTGRVVWVADSFAGLPLPVTEWDPDMSPGVYPQLAVSLETVRELFARYGLLDEGVRFVPGWFRDTLPTLEVQHLALLRIDADLYSSTLDVLEALYDKVSPRGFVIVDDYYAMDVCSRAVDEFRQRRGIHSGVERIDWTGIFWRKE